MTVLMPEIYPIGGGKGGVGKSFIAANLGALIAGQSKKVLLIDMDLGASNLHTFLGIKSPASGMHRFIDKTVKTLESTIEATPIPNLFFISSFDCSMEIANLYHAQKIKLIDAIRKLSFDHILLDLGAGTNFNTLDFFLTSSRGIFVCTPEPTSIENAFRFIKAVYLRILKRLIKQYDLEPLIKGSANHDGYDSSTSQDIIDAVQKHDPKKASMLKSSLSQFRFNFIINQFRRNGDGALGDKIQTVCNQHFYSAFKFFGNITYDERVIGALLSKKIFVQKHPVADTTADLTQISKLLIHGDTKIANTARVS